MPTAQLSLFDADRLAERPYATDDFDVGIYRQARERALSRRYIEANSVGLVWRIVFDVDRPGAALAAEDAHLAPPTWTAVNRANGHAHLGYELELPVCRTDAARTHPLRYLAAIEDAYMRRLAADVGYSGLVCKNPRHAYWRVTTHAPRPYTLAEMAEWVELEPYKRRRQPQRPAGPLGRNVALFDALRAWAYSAIRAAKASGSFDAWHRAVHAQAELANGDYSGIARTDPLPASEVRAIAKSVATWTWRRFDVEASDARFSALQAHRGRLGGLASGAVRYESTQDARNQARLLAGEGQGQREIAAALGVSQQTISRWLRG